MKKLKLIVPIILVALMIAAAFYISNRIERNTSTVKEDNTFTQTEKTITGDIIKSGLADIGELATEEYYYTGVESFDSSKSIKGFELPFTTTRFIYSYDGVIKAGIDFEEIEVEKDDLKKLIVVTLPPSRILSSEIDHDSFKLYDEKQSIFNPLKVGDVNDTIKDLKKVENELEEIEALLASAADDVSGTPEEDRITSIRYDLEQIEISIRHQRKRFEEMECGAE